MSAPEVSVPVRGFVFGLDEALNATVPLPLPLAPLVTVSQDVLLLTPVHAHPVGAVTAVDPVPPLATTDWLVGVIEYEHAAAAWFTVNVWPAIVSVPLRAVPFGFTVALKATVPAPVPLAPLVTVSHGVLLLTPVHAQPASCHRGRPGAANGGHRLTRRHQRERAGRGARGQ